MTYFKNLEICINFPLTPSMANSLSCMEYRQRESPAFSSAVCLCYLLLLGRCLLTCPLGLAADSLKKDVWRCFARATFSPQTINYPSLGQSFSSSLQFIYQSIIPGHKDPKTNGFNLFKLEWV